MRFRKYYNLDRTPVTSIIIRSRIMDYRKFSETYYVRMDKGDEVVSGILDICRKENITSCIFTGIGGLSRAEIQTFIPEEGRFETHTVEGMLELVSLTGNVITDDDMNYYHHTHATVSYKDEQGHHMLGGHIKSLTVLYTAEIELRPVTGGSIKRVYNAETGTGFWDFRDN